jgi:hypothetical protein
MLAGARARRIKHVPVDGAELYANGVPMDEAQFRAAFAAYQAELDTLSPTAERDEWQLAQQRAAVQGWQSLPAPTLGVSPTSVVRIKPGIDTETTTLTPLAPCRAAMHFGCCRLPTSQPTDHRVEVHLELSTRHAVPGETSPDLRFQCSLVRVVCRCCSASDGTETERAACLAVRSL